MDWLRLEGFAERRVGGLEFDEAGGGRGVRDQGGTRAIHAEDALQVVDEAGNGSAANEVALPSFESTVGMPLIMAYDSDAEAAGDFPEKEMIREAP